MKEFHKFMSAIELGRTIIEKRKDPQNLPYDTIEQHKYKLVARLPDFKRAILNNQGTATASICMVLPNWSHRKLRLSAAICRVQGPPALEEEIIKRVNELISLMSSEDFDPVATPIRRWYIVK